MTARDFLLHTLEVVYYYHEYGSYSKNERMAIRALRRRCPDYPIQECERSFNRILGLYKKAIKFVEKNEGYYHELYRRKAGKHALSRKEIAFFNEHKDIPRFVIISAINSIFYWRHLR